ncbi:MAG: hypothetical protein IT349_02550 [Candidatus Eisenbacteria bacterium]|nr:hypothetical protein [Candidatus Eisenbacteria bacterium]
MIRSHRHGDSARFRGLTAGLLALGVVAAATGAQVETPVPADQRGRTDAERSGTHDAANIRTAFWNYGMVGDFPQNPGAVDLSVFHSCEVPKGSGMNYSDGITPFVLAKITQRDSTVAYIMETGYRERQAISPRVERMMRFEPRPGYFQPDPGINVGRSPAVSNDARTWPDFWPDKINDPDDAGWSGSWNGYFGKRAAADQESYTVMDDDIYEGFNFRADDRDPTRNGLGLRIEVRGFQWANPQAGNVIFWHYDITNEGTTTYDKNIIFGLYNDSGVGGSALSCDGIYESDDDNAYFDRTFDQDVINLVYTWDKYGHGRDLSGSCGRTGYLGYAYLETPGNPFDRVDNDEDGITDERRDGGPGELIVGREAIDAWVRSHYDVARFEREYGPISRRLAYRVGRFWTGDEDMDWNPELHDVGADGVAETKDAGELDGMPTAGEPSFDRTDLNESDQIGLTGFKFNRIKAGLGNPNQETDNVLFYTEAQNWPQRLYDQFSATNPVDRFDPPLAANYNIGFLFASGPFILNPGQTERFSLALAYGGDLPELRRTVGTVQQIYDANYQFATPPPSPVVTAETGDGYVRLSWSEFSERAADPVTGEQDFEGYRIYRSTDPEFRDPRVIQNGTGSGTLGNGRPIAQFDLPNQRTGFSSQVVEGVAYYLGNDSGITHTFTDSTVTNGQLYYYAVTAYDSGSDSLEFYPSENAIPVSRTPRGGTILPDHVVAVRPEPKALGWRPAELTVAEQVAGTGVGSVRLEVVNSEVVPEGHLMSLVFESAAPESIRASSYALRDSTDHRTLFRFGRDLSARGVGPVGGGILPIVATGRFVEVDGARSGFTTESPTNGRLKVTYQPVLDRNLRRDIYPADLRIEFADTVVDTGLAMFPVPLTPANFRIYASTPSGEQRVKFRFRDRDGDHTLSREDEFIDIVSFLPGQPTVPQITWRAAIDTTGQRDRGDLEPPGEGDVYHLRLRLPFSVADRFTFQTAGERVDPEAARAAKLEPYVVPNPYVAAASFEPERFAVSGRGDRRMEFRGLPRNCTIRIYTVRGELVQTLRHDGGNDGMVPWDLRTKDNLDVAPGLYVFHVDGGPAGTHLGKFAIIK